MERPFTAMPRRRIIKERVNMRHIKIKALLSRVAKINLKAIYRKIFLYDFKRLISDIRGFNYKSPSAYKKLLQDKVFQKRLISFIVIIFFFIMIKGCIFKPKHMPVMPRPVQTGLVVEKDVPMYVDSFGTLSAIQEVDIKAQVTGKIKAVHFKNGDEVKKGDLLYTIDPSEYDAQAKKAQASLDQSAADLKLKTDTLERNKKLVERDLISKQEFESLQTELAAAQAKVNLDRAALDLAKISLGYCYITSPIDGVTAKSMLDPGNIVTADDGPVLVNIKNIDTLYADFTLSERELSCVRQAMGMGSLAVELRPEGEKDSYNGELVFIDNSVDNMTGTIYARALFDNKARKLWAGEFATIRLILSTIKDAVLAPHSAVKIGQKGHYLFVFAQDSKADLRLIQAGIRQGDYIVIEKGVNPGERVIITGILGLYPGAPLIDVEAHSKKQGEGK
jgi:membrane fusion protein, multidrug efflux system